MNSSEPGTHSIGTSIFLHLLPGILKGSAYFAIVSLVITQGYPSILALVFANIVVLLPIGLGLLLYLARKKPQPDQFDNIICYREKISKKQYLIWITVLFVVSSAILLLLSPVSEFLEAQFSWIPRSYHPDSDVGLWSSGTYSMSVLVTTCFLGFLFSALIGPIAEEYYFRGYLLPRMPQLKGWTPTVHSALFAVYHFWSPWQIVSRTLGVLPLIYVVQRKRNIYIGMWVHCLLNSVEYLVGAVIIVTLL